MACLDNIVTLGVCDTVAPISGLTLLSAAGMNLKGFANIATDSSGMEMVEEKKQLALSLVYNDFTAALTAANVLPQVTNREYEASIFKSETSMGTSTLGRGVVLHKAGSYYGSLRETHINGVEIFPLQTGTGVLRIVDGSTTTNWDISFDGGVSNFYDFNQLEGFPYTVVSNTAKVLIIADGVSFASSVIQCKKGCSGSPNPCGWIDGWDGNKAYKHEGYGVNITFECICNYESILCKSARVIGEIIWLRWQIEIFKEQYLSNRFNWFVTYNQDKINEEILPTLNTEYATKWGNFERTLPNLLLQYKDECLQCRGIRWVTNI